MGLDSKQNKIPDTLHGLKVIQLSIKSSSSLAPSYYRHGQEKETEETHHSNNCEDDTVQTPNTQLLIMQANYSHLHLTTSSWQHRKKNKSRFEADTSQKCGLCPIKVEHTTTLPSEHVCYHSSDLFHMPQSYLLAEKLHIFYSFFRKGEDPVNLTAQMLLQK